MEFSYAHNRTGRGERETQTMRFNTLELPHILKDMYEKARAKEIPVSDLETLNLLKTLLSIKKPQKILELGTAIGLSGGFMLDICTSAHLTTVEKNEEFFEKAKENFKSLGFCGRVNCILGDAGEIIKGLEGNFDFIFLDSAKVQYIKYLPELKRLLTIGGVLVADDVLLYGWVTGEAPKKRKMLAEHLREYITAVTSDEDLSTTVLDVGDGAAVSVKIK